MTVIRVFPRRTAMTPVDELAFVGEPPMIRPAADEIHISCTFTWDLAYAQHLRDAWTQYYPVVKLGGVALGDYPESFVAGRYIKAGVTFTSRGCNHACGWCSVHKREGEIRELSDFPAGYIIQDNNLLQCSRAHISRVFEMLRAQRRSVTFSGGLESDLVTAAFVDELRSVKVDQVFLAADSAGSISKLRRAVKLLELPRYKIRCFVLLKYRPAETMSQSTGRMLDVWDAGAIPFAQLFQPPDEFIEYPLEWRRFARTWQRPAATATRATYLKDLEAELEALQKEGGKGDA